MKNFKRLKYVYMIVLSVMMICMGGCAEYTEADVKTESQKVIAAKDNTDEKAEEEIAETSIETSMETGDGEFSESIEVVGEQYRYEVIRFRKDDTRRILRWQVNVYKEEDLIQEIYFEHDELADGQMSLEDSIWEEDVNFDGVKDLLLCQGHYSTRNGLGYRCYLANVTGDGLEHCQGFEEITSPWVNTRYKWVLSAVRTNESLGYQKYYEFNGQNFTLIKTEIYELDEKGNFGQLIYSSDDEEGSDT